MGKGKRNRTIRQEAARATVGQPQWVTKMVARAVKKEYKRKRRAHARQKP